MVLATVLWRHLLGFCSLVHTEGWKLCFGLALRWSDSGYRYVWCACDICCLMLTLLHLGYHSEWWWGSLLAHIVPLRELACTGPLVLVMSTRYIQLPQSIMWSMTVFVHSMLLGIRAIGRRIQILSANVVGMPSLHVQRLGGLLRLLLM